MPFYHDDHTFAMRKGSGNSQAITILSNAGSSSQSYSVTVKGSKYPSGTKLIDLYSCDKVTVGNGGSITVQVKSGLPKVLVPASYAGSALCG